MNWKNRTRKIAPSPQTPNVKNFSYTIVDGQVYYRENSLMHPVEVSVTGRKPNPGHDRAAGMCTQAH